MIRYFCTFDLINYDVDRRYPGKKSQLISDLISKRWDGRYIQNGRVRKMERKNGLMNEYEQDRQAAHTLQENKRSNDSLPNVIYFAHDKGNNIDLLFLRGQEKDKRSGMEKNGAQTLYRRKTWKKTWKKSKKISSFIFHSKIEM